MELAIFDLDGTLVSGSSERRFWRYLWRRGRLGTRQLAAFAGFALRYLPVAGGDVMRTNKAYLAGLETAEVASLASEFVASELIRHLYDPAVTRLERHLDRGDVVLLQTGTLHAIARPLADALGVTHVCATRCCERDGTLLAEPPARHPFAAAKLHYAREFAAGLDLDLAAAAAYCDSYRDLPLLDAVAHPVAVRPDRRLRAVALARRWELLAPSGEAESIPACSAEGPK